MNRCRAATGTRCPGDLEAEAISGREGDQRGDIDREGVLGERGARDGRRGDRPGRRGDPGDEGRLGGGLRRPGVRHRLREADEGRQLHRQGRARRQGHGRQRLLLAAAHHISNTFALLETFLFHKDAQHRGYKMQNRDTLVPNGPYQISAVLMSTRLGHDQPSARNQRPEKFPNRYIKSEWRLL